MNGDVVYAEGGFLSTDTFRRRRRLFEGLVSVSTCSIFLGKFGTVGSCFAHNTSSIRRTDSGLLHQQALGG